MQESNRRNFLTASAALLAGAPAIAANRMSANDRIRVCIVGLRGRGRDHIQCLNDLANENIEIAALCDVDQVLLAQRAADYEKLSGKKVKTFTDMQKVLDDKSFDAVTFATPNHWHALGAVWACQAGKDAYVEKPGTQTFQEGKKIMEAAGRYKRIIQHGTQNRTSPNIVEGIQKLKEGVIGRVYLARGVDYKVRFDWGKIEPEATPASLNWGQVARPSAEKALFKIHSPLLAFTVGLRRG